jgi:hypothetical protein
MTLDLALSPETAALHAALAAVPLGETITYDSLSAVIGRDVRRGAQARLASARRIAERDNGAVFETLRKTGLRRLLPDEAPDIGSSARHKLRRTSRRAIKGMMALAENSNGLTPASQRRLSAEIGTHGLLMEIASDKATARQETADRPNPPAIAGRAFLEHIGVLK